MKKRILITGGNGYIAKSLAVGLKNYEIEVITRAECDLTNYDKVCKFLDDKYFDVIVHTAIRGGSRLKIEEDYIMNYNLNMHWNLLANQSNYKKFISFGSGAELYATHTPYGFSKKVIAESIAEKENHYNIRIYGVFDQNELDTRFIKGNILRYLKEDSIVIHKNKKMDFFYMPDLITLVQHYIDCETALPKVVDCSYEDHYSLFEIANKINSLGDHKVDIKLLDEYEDISYTGCGDLINLSYIGLDKGIKQVYQLLKQQL